MKAGTCKLYIYLLSFNCESHSVAAAEAERDDPAPRLPALHFVKQCYEAASSTSADRMPERYSAAVNIYALRIEFQLTRDRERRHRESLIQLRQIYTRLLPAGLLNSFLTRH